MHRTRYLVRGAILAALPVVATMLQPRPAQAQDTTVTDTTMVFIADTAAAADDSASMMFGMMNQFMGPMMGRIAEAMVQGIVAALSEPQTAEHLARFTRNYFEALVRQGFTEEQALRLTAAIGFPMLAPGGG